MESKATQRAFGVIPPEKLEPLAPGAPLEFLLISFVSGPPPPAEATAANATAATKTAINGYLAFIFPPSVAL